ncbi:MAG TPA: hypothetical protein VJ803_05015 [Gemmatimonadaceae bacterium]|nr:hypothetical protein [Gemmatimonadaceae bacterium]
MRSPAYLLAPLALMAAIATSFPTTAEAQVFGANQPRQQRPSRFFIGGHFMVATPQDEFADYVDTGFGFGGHLIYALDQAGAVGLRVDLGFVNYGRESRRTCLSTTIGCRIQVEIETSNNIVVFGVGPHFMVPNGRFRPYLTGTAGLAYFFTESSLEGVRDFDDEEFFQTTNFDDVTFAWTGAAGIYIPLRRGLRPISLDLGVRYHGNGEARYLREGSIEDQPGTIIITPIESKTNLLVYQIGVVFGL